MTEATSGRQVTVYNQAPALRGRFDVLFDNYPDLDTNFNGFDLTVERRLATDGCCRAAPASARAWATFFCVVAYVSTCTSVMNNPNFMFRRGLIGNDTPYAFRMSGIYVLPYQVWVSATAQHNAGFPEITSVLVSGNTVALTQVNQSLVVEPRGTTRLPPLNSIDFSIKRPFKRGAVSFEPRLDLYNLANSATDPGPNHSAGPDLQPREQHSKGSTASRWGSISSLRRGPMTTKASRRRFLSKAMGWPVWLP